MSYDVNIKIKGNTSDIKKKSEEARSILDQLENKIKSSAESWLGFGLGAGAGFAIAEKAVSAGMSAITGTVQEGIGLVTDAFGRLDEVGDVAGNLGAGADVLLGLQGSAEAFGSSAEAVNGVISKMRNNLAQGKGFDAFKKLNLDINELKANDPTTNFIKISEALAGVDDENERLNLALDIFGKKAGEVFAMFSGDIQDSIKYYQELNGNLSQTDINAVGNADQAVKDLGTAYRGIGNILAKELAPAIEVVAKNLTEATVANHGFFESLGQIGRKAPLVFESMKANFNILTGQKSLKDASVELLFNIAEIETKTRQAEQNAKNIKPPAPDEEFLNYLEQLKKKSEETQAAIQDIWRSFDTQNLNSVDSQLFGIMEDQGATGAQIAEMQAISLKNKELEKEAELKKKIADDAKAQNELLKKSEQDAANIKESLLSKEEKLHEQLANVEKLRQDDLLTEVEALREKERLLAQITGDPAESNFAANQASLATRNSSEANRIIHQNQAPKDQNAEAQKRIQERQLEELKETRRVLTQILSRQKEAEFGGII